MNGKVSVFDALRKKWVRMTPEEEVRQRFLAMLIEHFNYPASLMANEVEIRQNGNSLRADSVVYNNQGKPVMLIEYKAPNIPLSEKTVDQIASYNIAFQVPYLMLSNGIKHYCLKVDYINKKLIPLSSFPKYDEIATTL